MNADLAQIVSYYTTRPHKDLNDLLLEKSKDNLIAVLTDLLTAYINDNNSSSLREFITVSIAGYNHNPNKLGYNGYKQSTSIGAKPVACEAKPKNIKTQGYELKKSKAKLDGGGGFNDYTIDRLRKDVKENPNILSSGFVDGQLLYILEFPFRAIAGRLGVRLPKKRIKGTYLRTAGFNFSHYKRAKNLKVIYVDKQAIGKNLKYLNQTFASYLLKQP